MSRRRGVLVFVLLLVLLGSAVLFAALSLRGPTTAATAHSVLVYDVPSRLDEGPPPTRSLTPDAIRRAHAPTVWDVVRGLDRAAADERIEALVLHIDGLDWGWGKLQEVRSALERFRAAGKPVYASLASGGDPEYFLASAADVVASPPTVTLRIDGLSLSALFQHGTLEKLGVSANFRRVGEYKSGVEPWTRSGFSNEARANYEAILDERWNQLLGTVAGSRGLDADSVRRLLDAGPFLASEALAAGLIDTLLYDAEVDTLAASGGDRRRTSLDFRRYLARGDVHGRGPRIAVVSAEGTIAPGRSRSAPGGDDVLGAETLVGALRDLRRRSSVRAVVLRIDSPGGDAQASDDIWREVEKLSATRPVIVSMSDVAASGGYYVAAGATRIVAQPATLTGSIGIYGGKLNVRGLLDKLGFTVETLSRGRHAEMLSPYRDFTEEEGALYQRQLEDFYRGFLDRVAVSRRSTPEAIDSLARGRVWTGREAQAIGLVDTLGGFETAMSLARREAGLDPDEPVSIERWPSAERSFLQQLLESLLDEDELEAVAAPALPRALARLAALAAIPPGRELAWLPVTLDVR